MEIKIEISEGDITAVKPGMPITYTILSNPETEYKATLTSIDPGLTTLTDGSYKTTSSTGSSASVSYTHLDVYKRQLQYDTRQRAFPLKRGRPAPPLNGARPP